jgi:hypothetical protein
VAKFNGSSSSRSQCSSRCDTEIERSETIFSTGCFARTVRTKSSAISTRIIVAEIGATRFIRRAPFLAVIVGVAAPGFAAMRTLARASMDAGAAGVMIAPPNSLRNDDQIVTYYPAAEVIGADVPLVTQDYPVNFSVVMSAGVIRRIVSDQPFPASSSSTRIGRG